nr:lysozyme [Vibrio scophthalmi]
MSVKSLINKTVCSIGAVLAIVFTTAPDMKTSQRGLEHIANLEGCRSKAYQCSANVWTNGLGHTGGVKPGDIVTNQQIAHNFIGDVQKAEQVVTKGLTRAVTQSQFDVLVSFVFNLGSGNFRQSTMLKFFNRGEWQAACREFPRWVYVDGKNCRESESNCPGIVTRRDVEMNACLYGWDHASQ